uniref:GB1/RHD3-type G domain-containing protein n=1 Tax=Strigamia maritima TaxID=126957 RepID=T1ILU6_STRMM
MDKPLDGFRWSRGAASVTKGIWMWSKPLIKGDVAIFLMDVQGSFDAKQSEQANTNVLAWSTMISTVTIFNLMSDLQMNYLDNLNYCTEYARIAVRNKNENPFQKLIFLIRDWERISSHVHGFGGGMAYLNTWLTDNNEDQNPTRNNEVQNPTRNNGNTQQPPETNKIQNLLETFTELQCFLMPHPGVKAWLMGNFKGEPKFIEPYFLEYLDMFVPNVVNNIKVNTLLRTGPELYTFIEDYIKAVSDAEMPKAEEHFNLQVKSHNIKAVELAEEKYEELMKQANVLKCDSSSAFNEAHEKAFKEAVEYFLNLPKLDQNKNNQEFIKQLGSKLNRGGECKFDVCQENEVRKKTRILGYFSIGSGTVLTVGAGATYVLTTATGVACAATGIGGLVIISAGAICLIASKRKKIWGFAKTMFSNTTAKFRQSENNFINDASQNDLPPAYTETDSLPAYTETDSSPALYNETDSSPALYNETDFPPSYNETYNSHAPANNPDGATRVYHLSRTSEDNTLLTISEKQMILILILIAIIVCLLFPYPSVYGLIVASLIALLAYFYIAKYI